MLVLVRMEEMGMAMLWIRRECGDGSVLGVLFCLVLG